MFDSVHLPLKLTGLCYQQLNVDQDEVEELLVGLILEGKVEGRIDQVGMRLELDRKQGRSSLLVDSLLTRFDRPTLAKRRYTALDKWTEALENVYSAVITKSGGNQQNDPRMGGGMGGMGMDLGEWDTRMIG